MRAIAGCREDFPLAFGTLSGPDKVHVSDGAHVAVTKGGATGVGFRTIRASDIDVLGAGGAIEAITERVADLPVYLSIDIDVLDPSFAPGTGTPEAGGLSSRELLRVLRGLTNLNLVSGDLVEVSPAYDHAEITSLAAATVIFDVLTQLGKKS